MKKIFVSILALFSLIICSCNFNTDDKGSLVVRNESENNSVYISAVYVMESEASGYQLVWTGKIENNSSEFIKLEPGKYAVKIEATNSFYDIRESKTAYETGYNIYKKLDSDGFINVIFDGKGVYFE